MQQKLPVLLLAVVALSGALYFLLIFLIPFLGMQLISAQQETKIGGRLKEVMLQESALMGSKIDSAGTVHLQAFADKLNLSNAYPIRVTLLKNDMVNAFALPGGHVVVFSGIIKKMDSPESLAALLAHESVHINERHSLKSLLRSAANSILVSVVFGDVTGISGALVGNANTLNGLRYSRSLEEEADKKGMELLVQNSIEVKGMLQLMQTLKAEADIPKQLSFLSSHPLTSERIKAAESFIKQHPQKGAANATLQALFTELKK